MTTSAPFDRIANRYDETRSLDTRRSLAGFLTSWLVPGLVLDVGVGTGQVASGLRDAGYNVVGVDLSEPMLVRARERLGRTLVRGDARALPIADNVMANVVFVASLVSIRDVPRAFSEAARVLRMGGRLLATYDSPIIRSENGMRDDIMDAAAPLDDLEAFQRPDTKEALDAAAKAVGLTSVSHTVSDEMPRRTSPESFARQLEDRVFSVLWDINDDSWNRVVVPTIERLRALPEPNRPRVRNHSYRIGIYQRRSMRSGGLAADL